MATTSARWRRAEDCAALAIQQRDAPARPQGAAIGPGPSAGTMRSGDLGRLEKIDQDGRTRISGRAGPGRPQPDLALRRAAVEIRSRNRRTDPLGRLRRSPVRSAVGRSGGIAGRACSARATDMVRAIISEDGARPTDRRCRPGRSIAASRRAGSCASAKRQERRNGRGRLRRVAQGLDERGRALRRPERPDQGRQQGFSAPDPADRHQGAGRGLGQIGHPPESRPGPDGFVLGRPSWSSADEKARASASRDGQGLEQSSRRRQARSAPRRRGRRRPPRVQSVADERIVIRSRKGPGGGRPPGRRAPEGQEPGRRGVALRRAVKDGKRARTALTRAGRSEASAGVWVWAKWSRRGTPRPAQPPGKRERGEF